ncbi:MAG: hypothetical protein ACOCRO_00825 [Halanaerobiales bacterium]
MTTIFRDDFRKYYTAVFPVEIEDANIGVTNFDSGKIEIGAVWEPPSNIDDGIEDEAERKRIYRDIISKLSKKQQKELLGYILSGRAKR